MTRHPPPRPNLYAVISRAVEEGTVAGIHRSRKYLEPGQHAPDDILVECVEIEVMNALCEVLELEDQR